MSSADDSDLLTWEASHPVAARVFRSKVERMVRDGNRPSKADLNRLMVESLNAGLRRTISDRGTALRFAQVEGTKALFDTIRKMRLERGYGGGTSR